MSLKLPAASDTQSGTVSREYNGSGTVTTTIDGGTWSFDSQFYRVSIIGKTVNLWVRIEGGTAASGLTSLLFSLPSDCPQPNWLSNNGNSELGFVGRGYVSTDVSGTPVSGTAFLYRTGGGSTQVYFKCSSIAAKLVDLHYTYPIA